MFFVEFQDIADEVDYIRGINRLEAYHVSIFLNSYLEDILTIIVHFFECVSFLTNIDIVTKANENRSKWIA